MTRVSVYKAVGNHQMRFESETFKMSDSLPYQNANRPLCNQLYVTYVAECHRLASIWMDVDLENS